MTKSGEKNSFIIGVDIGGTNTVIGMVDFRGACVVQMQFPTAEKNSAESFISHLALSIKNLCDALPSGAGIAGIGIGAPAARRWDGSIQSPANLSWGTMGIVNLLQEHFSVPIAVINDSNAAALGEFYYGDAKGKKNVIVLTLGTGVGSGIIVDGILMEGSKGFAGEVGHTILERHGRVCGCGRHGCVETYVSAAGVVRTAVSLLAHHSIESRCRNISVRDLTAEKIFAYAVKGDDLSIKAFQYTGEYLGRMLADVATMFDPEMFILAGGLMEAKEFILPRTIESFNETVLHFHQNRVEIVASDFSGSEGAILGASSLFSQHASYIDRRYVGSTAAVSTVTPQ